MKRSSDSRLGLSAILFVVAALVCTACWDPGTAEDNSTQLTFSHMDPGYEVQLEFSDKDTQTFELGVENQSVRETNQILTLGVPSSGRTDGQTNSDLYCFQDPVVLVSVENESAPVTIINSGDCMNSQSSLNYHWVQPAILDAPNIIVDGITNQEWPGFVKVLFAEDRTSGISGPAAEGSRIVYDLDGDCIGGEVRFELRKTGETIHAKDDWCLSDDGKFHIDADELFANE